MSAQGLVLLLAGALVSSHAQAQITVSAMPSVPSPAPVGTLVTWTAAVTGAAPGSFQYRFVVRGSDEGRVVIRDFSPDATFEWLPHEREGWYEVEVAVRNSDTGESALAVVPYELSSNVVSGEPVVHETVHPLVSLYSAPPCPAGGVMTVYFLSPDNVMQYTPAKACDGAFSMNFYIAGLRPASSYYIKHIIQNGQDFTEGPLLTFVSGEVSADLPSHRIAVGAPASQVQPVMLAGSLFANFVATDLSGNLIWYYPKQMLYFTHPERGGTFFGLDEDESGDPYKQILREFDLTGTTVLETNAACLNEQLKAMGKRTINAFHHEARRLSNGNIVVLAGVEQILTDVQGPGPVNVLGDMIIVLNPNLEVVWTWDGFDHLDTRRIATQRDMCSVDSCPPLLLAPQANDWLHGNAVTETPEGNLLFSMRSQDWVIKIDYRGGDGSGDVLWRLGHEGDFSIVSSDPQPWFSHQHDPEIEPDGLMSIFDNGNIRQAEDRNAHSRGQAYRLDEANRVAELVLNADLGVYAFALGTAQQLEDGNYFFDAGFRADGTGISIETDPAGQVKFAIESSAPEYRTFRMKNMYNP